MPEPTGAALAVAVRLHAALLSGGDRSRGAMLPPALAVRCLAALAACRMPGPPTPPSASSTSIKAAASVPTAVLPLPASSATEAAIDPAAVLPPSSLQSTDFAPQTSLEAVATPHLRSPPPPPCYRLPPCLPASALPLLSPKQLSSLAVAMHRLGLLPAEDETSAWFDAFHAALRSHLGGFGDSNDLADVLKALDGLGHQLGLRCGGFDCGEAGVGGMSDAEGIRLRGGGCREGQAWRIWAWGAWAWGPIAAAGAP